MSTTPLFGGETPWIRQSVWRSQTENIPDNSLQLAGSGDMFPIQVTRRFSKRSHKIDYLEE
jgi:hypothetical protein